MCVSEGRRFEHGSWRVPEVLDPVFAKEAEAYLGNECMTIFLVLISSTVDLK